MDEERHHHSEHSKYHTHHSEHHTSHSEEAEHRAAASEQRISHPSRGELWRETKKKQRKARREYYRSAPWFVKAWKFWLKKLVVVLLVMAAAMVGFFHSGLAGKLLESYIERVRDDPVSKETIYSMAPLDEEGSARIDAMEPYGKDDSWTVCVYIVGSDFEDCGENDLSALTKMLTEPVKEKNGEQRRELDRKHLNTFIEELDKKGMELPEYLYQPVQPVVSSVAAAEDVIAAEEQGAASDDIKEITSGVWGDNITVVLQTGGAKRWSNSMMNPNKTQRFAYKSGVLSKVSELPLQDSCAPETLSDFLRFCEEKYPADHRMLIFWNHGSGVNSFGNDRIFGSALTLKQLRQALETVYKPSLSKPAFDILGFDACLMATAETAHTFDGFASYLVASEELEPTSGWNYAPWLQALTDEPTMNAAQVGRAITDAYVDCYMAFNNNLGALFGNDDVTMSVVDVHKAALAYNAYCELCAAQLKDAAGDLSVLANMGRAADSVTRYGKSFCDEVNSFDMGGYMELLADSYPDEAQKVQTKLRDAVLYHRQSKGLEDSQGLAVYVPAKTGSLDALMNCISFAYDVSENRYVSALYYYKAAGCLNEKMSELTEALAGREPEVLDVRPFREFQYASPAIGENDWSVSAGESLLDRIQDCKMELVSYDADSERVTCYGRDEYVQPNGEGSLLCSFEGEWITLDGVPLSTEIVSSSAAAVEYRSKVKCQGENFYLLFTYNRDSEDFTINGLKKIETGTDALLLPNSKKTDTVLAGKIIIPVYSSHSFESGEDSEIEGKKIFFTFRSKIKMKRLPEGTYLSTVVISDPRGDNYCSGAVEQIIVGDRIVTQNINTDFYGTD